MVPFVLKILTRVVSFFRRPSSFSERFLWLQPDCNTWQQHCQLQSVECIIQGRGKCSEYCSTFRSEDIDSRGFFLQTTAELFRTVSMIATRLQYMAATLSALKRRIYDRRTMEVFWILRYLSYWRYWLAWFHFADDRRAFQNGFYDCNKTAIHGSNIISSKASNTW